MDTTIVKRYCPNGHKFQIKPTFVACCSQANGKIHPPNHYPNGHEYTKANTTLPASGGRRCKLCGEARRRRERTKGRQTPKQRKEAQSFLKLRDGGLCRYCGQPGVEVDHVVPRSNNGSESTFGNMVWCCRRCNGVKGAREGFSMRNSRLYYEGQLIAPSHLFGADLRTRLR